LEEINRKSSILEFLQYLKINHWMVILVLLVRSLARQVLWILKTQKILGTQKILRIQKILIVQKVSLRIMKILMFLSCFSRVSQVLSCFSGSQDLSGLRIQ